MSLQVTYLYLEPRNLFDDESKLMSPDLISILMLENSSIIDIVNTNLWSRVVV
jgi:hypothetical protein